MSSDDFHSLYGRLCDLLSVASGYMVKATELLVEMRRLLNGGIKTRSEIMRDRDFKEDFPNGEEDGTTNS